VCAEPAAEPAAACASLGECAARAEQALAARRYPAAALLFARVAELAPAQPSALSALANVGAIHQLQRQWAPARQQYLRILALQPAHSGSMFNLGVLASEGHGGAFEEALGHYRACLAVQPAHVDAWVNLGAQLQLRGRLDDSAGCFERALALDPQDGYSWNNLGVVLRTAGRGAEAVAALQEAVGALPHEAAMHASLGKALEEAGGRAEESVGSYRTAAFLQRLA
jgi:Tfp pilus assembly protein PilF